ncbi:MAG: hypothetical protein D6B27_03835 [Gammaproteobacteria bacterium]|nr:MAG: hypothetical protein D6B27_03835 [Gammaproteobacteria bacterium]
MIFEIAVLFWINAEAQSNFACQLIQDGFFAFFMEAINLQFTKAVLKFLVCNAVFVKSRKIFYICF